MCMTCDPVADRRPSGIAIDPNPRLLSSLTEEELELRHRQWLEINAALPTPLPVCRVCDMPYGLKDGSPLFKRTCDCCAGGILEEMTFDFIYAKGRKARKKAARRLRRLAAR